MKELYTGNNVTVLEASKIMKKSPQYIRQGIKTGLLPIGKAIKIDGSSKYTYYISPKLLKDYTGAPLDD
ncbi:hypothetical protein [Veillonella parvula]|uniref:hypothetical protein n=1 Tax=Veillonella parvula TaxID=29466 RepID=UPI0024929541|nr:hypothetical protein [Veillonella parvula]